MELPASWRDRSLDYRDRGNQRDASGAIKEKVPSDKCVGRDLPTAKDPVRTQFEQGAGRRSQDQEGKGERQFAQAREKEGGDDDEAAGARESSQQTGRIERASNTAA